jgi:putative FmdB family regulatory protein
MCQLRATNRRSRLGHVSAVDIENGGGDMLLMAFPAATASVDGEHMPTYQFRCEKCGKKFERTETIPERESGTPKCPKRGSRKATFVPGRVYVVTSKKS